MLHIMDYNHPSDEESSSPRNRYIVHANICMVKTDDNEDDVRSNKVDNVPVLILTILRHYAASTTSTEISQPMVLTTHEDMYQGFVEALSVHPNETVSSSSHGMRPPVETITVNVPTHRNIAPPRRN